MLNISSTPAFVLVFRLSCRICANHSEYVSNPLPYAPWQRSSPMFQAHFLSVPNRLWPLSSTNYADAVYKATKRVRAFKEACIRRILCRPEYAITERLTPRLSRWF
eukprot:TRINITY_DN10590_c0_g5_i1.p3 TRINITY_DN10590_c0_g5~~TRINITY_DN10590_c0_g5_i1.p3  ORF type:complete len:106 (-),score=5.57 TRINITY_DN10590_c0_g5_i1:461-778(-)